MRDREWTEVFRPSRSFVQTASQSFAEEFQCPSVRRGWGPTLLHAQDSWVPSDLLPKVRSNDCGRTAGRNSVAMRDRRPRSSGRTSAEQPGSAGRFYRQSASWVGGKAEAAEPTRESEAPPSVKGIRREARQGRGAQAHKTAGHPHDRENQHDRTYWYDSEYRHDRQHQVDPPHLRGHGLDRHKTSRRKHDRHHTDGRQHDPDHSGGRGC